MMEPKMPMITTCPTCLYHRRITFQTHILGSHVGFPIASWIFIVFRAVNLRHQGASSPIRNGADSATWLDCPWRRTLSSVQCLSPETWRTPVKRLRLNHIEPMNHGLCHGKLMGKLMGFYHILPYSINLPENNPKMFRMSILVEGEDWFVGCPWCLRVFGHDDSMQFMQLRCSGVVKSPGPTPRSCSRRSYHRRARFRNAKMRCLAVCVTICPLEFLGHVSKETIY